jgi:hypothetical protein
VEPAQDTSSISEMDTAQHAAQIEWENSAVTRGVQRYRASLVKDKNDGSQVEKDLSELGVGTTIMRDVFPSILAVVKESQFEAATVLSSTSGKGTSGGRPQGWAPWHAPILALDPETLTLITLQSALADGRIKGGGAPLSLLARSIGSRVCTQLSFEAWKKAQNKVAREHDMPSFWKLMAKRSPAIIERTYRKWRKQSERYAVKTQVFDGVPARVDWGTAAKVHLGTKLVHLLVEHGSGWFQCTAVGRHSDYRYTTQLMFALTAVANHWLTAEHAEREMNRPMLIPMKHKPRDWRRG